MSPNSFSIEFSNLTYIIDKSGQGECFGKKRKKRGSVEVSPTSPNSKKQNGQLIEILTNVSGYFETNKLTCIMGPSGAGKSSLLNVLAGRISETSVTGSSISGTVSINGRLINPVDHKGHFAYVMQDDSLYPTMTPREAILFSAKLKLFISEEEREERCKDLIDSLGLTGCQNTYIGSPLIKGISGGERKRTSVAIELIKNPNVVFCDEPTTGLDSYTAYNICDTLKTLSHGGKCVLCTIHQPSSEIFSLFDEVLFLASGGRIVYQGPVDSVCDYFRSVGYNCPENYNPADYVLFIIQTVDSNQLNILCDSYSNSDMKTKNTENIEVRRKNSNATDFPRLKRCSFWTQLREVYKRDARNVVRDKVALGARFGITVFLSVLYGLVFQGIGGKSSTPTENSSHFGAVTMLTISAMFTTAQPMLLAFPFERPVFLREYAAEMYGPVPYMLAKSFSEFFLTFFQSLISVGIAYLLMDLQGFFLGVQFPLFLLGAVSSSLAVAVGCWLPDASKAMEFAPIIFVPQILFAGFFISMSQIPVYLRWAQWLCGLKYALNMVVLQEFSGDFQDKLISDNDIQENWYAVYAIFLIGLIVCFRTIGVFGLYYRGRTVY